MEQRLRILRRDDRGAGIGRLRLAIMLTLLLGMTELDPDMRQVGIYAQRLPKKIGRLIPFTAVARPVGLLDQAVDRRRNPDARSLLGFQEGEHGRRICFKS